MTSIAAVPEPAFLSRRVAGHRRALLDLAPDPRQPLAVVCAGWERCAGDYLMAREGFPWLGLELVASGGGTLEIAGRHHRLEPGACFAYGPGVRHVIRADRAHPPLKYFADFTGREAVALLARAGLPPGGFVRLADPAPLRACLDGLIEAGRRGGRLRGELCAAHLRAALLTLADLRPADHSAAIADGGAHATFARCRALIDGADGALTTVAGAARACAVGPTHLSRLFRRFAGTTVADHLRAVRLRRAADLLREPGMNVTRAAAELGFSNPFHFSRAFRRVYGRPPSALLRLAGD